MSQLCPAYNESPQPHTQQWANTATHTHQCLTWPHTHGPRHRPDTYRTNTAPHAAIEQRCQKHTHTHIHIENCHMYINGSPLSNTPKGINTSTQAQQWTSTAPHITMNQHCSIRCNVPTLPTRRENCTTHSNQLALLTHTHTHTHSQHCPIHGNRLALPRHMQNTVPHTQQSTNNTHTDWNAAPYTAIEQQCSDTHGTLSHTSKSRPLHINQPTLPAHMQKTALHIAIDQQCPHR